MGSNARSRPTKRWSRVKKVDALRIAAALLPCPFCGAKPVETIRGAGDTAPNPKARCITDGCAGSNLPVICLDVPENVSAWNQRAPQPAQWQPIETAPQDGTVIIGYNNGRVGNASRVQRDDCEMWTFAGTSASVEHGARYKPTHRMPLRQPQQGETK